MLLVPCCLGTHQLISINVAAGVSNICDDVEFMLRMKPGIYWRICWGIVTPLLMIVILIYALVNMEPETYNGQLLPTSAYGNITNSFTFFIRMH